MKSIQFHTIRIAVGSLFISGVITCAAYYVEAARQDRERLFNEAERLAVTAEPEAAKLASGILVSEEYGSIPLLLDEFRTKEMLQEAKVTKDMASEQSNFELCVPAISGAITCIDRSRGLIASLSPIVLGGQSLGNLVKIKAFPKQDLRSQYMSLAFLVGGYSLTLCFMLIWLGYFVQKKVRRPLLNLSETLVPVLSEGGQGNFDVFDIEEIHVLAEQVKQIVKSHEERRAAAAVASMTSMLAHDVRKPFSILRMGINMLGSANSPESVRSVLVKLVPEIDRAVSSVDGLISDVMEVGSTSTQLIQEPVNPESILESALAETFKVYPKSNISITYSFKHTHMVNVSPQKIGRVFSNIIGNAVQAINFKGEIWFKTQESDGKIEFCLGNAGSLIAPENIAKLFDAFFTNGKKGGTGLGLAIAKKVVLAHGGEIWCESSCNAEFPKGKVEFFFTLPTASRQSEFNGKLPQHSSDVAKAFFDIAVKSMTVAKTSIDQTETDLEEDVTKTSRQLGRSLNVLIADDENVYRQGLAASFARTPELSNSVVIRMAAGSMQALELANKMAYDLVITDVDMGPRSLNGFELVHELRKVPGFGAESCLICVHSNRVVAADHKTAIDSGADAFISKPAARAQLLKLLLQAGKRAAGA